MDILFNCPRCGQHLAVEERGAEMLVNCPKCKAEIESPRRAAPSQQHAGTIRHFLREFNRVMTRGYTVIQPRQQPDSARERIRAQIIIAIFLIVISIAFVMAIFGKH
jgi:DNA-directed RNA polymerase subunit M/transcription elongation factor TFIIS